MSYTQHIGFSLHDDSNVPYALYDEPSHHYDTPNGRADNTGYRHYRTHTTALFYMPALREADVCFSCMLSDRGNPYCENSTEWFHLFDYDSVSRCGFALVFGYLKSERTLAVSLAKVSLNRVDLIRTSRFDDVSLLDGVPFTVAFSVKDGMCSGRCGGASFAFELPERTKGGILGLRVDHGGNGLYFLTADIASGETPRETVVLTKTDFLIPPYDGGSHDYRLTLEARAYENGVTRLSYTLRDGIMNAYCSGIGKDCAVPEYDYFEDMYLGFGDVRFMISNGALTFYGKNVPPLTISTCGHKELPLSGEYYMQSRPLPPYISFGYRYRRNCSYSFLAGGRHFVFGLDGSLIYHGADIGADCLDTMTSQKDKRIIELFDKNMVGYDQAVLHAEGNHTFLLGETARFTYEAHILRDLRFVRCRIYLADAFYTPVKELPFLAEEVTGNTFLSGFGYNGMKYTFAATGLPQGVYHVICELYDGDDANYFHRHVSAFEIIDFGSTRSPQESSGLPMLYAGDAAPLDTDSGVPDFYHPAGDENTGHYFSVAEYCPDTAEQKRIWEILHLYHRKLFVWMTKRTLGSTKESDYPETLKHADYLNLPFPNVRGCFHYYRADVWCPDIYASEEVRKMFGDFIALHPAYRAPFEAYLDGGRFTDELMKELHTLCFDEWVRYFNKCSAAMFLAENEAYRKDNPAFRRCSYGPFPLYGARLAGGYHMKWYGFDAADYAKVFDGFMQFEDYPFICGYATHESAFCLQTVKFLSPGSVIAPELYDTMDMGCVDGFVGLAFPPVGISMPKGYHTLTQAYEYLYNTPMFRDGTFSYFRDSAFMMYPLSCRTPKERFETFLKGYGVYKKHIPARPMRGVAFIVDFDAEDDRREFNIERDTLYNICESAEGYLHGIFAESGIPNPFVTDFASVTNLSAKDVYAVVVPSTRNAPEEAIKKLRELHREGVFLFGVGACDALKDVFGIRAAHHVSHVQTVSDGKESESVYPYDAEFFHVPDGGESLLETDGGDAVLIANGSAAYLNVSVCQVGADSYNVLPYLGRANISRLLRKVVAEVIGKAVTPDIYCPDGCGVTLCETDKGQTVLMLTDYSDYSVEDGEKYAEVVINRALFGDVRCVSDETAIVTRRSINGTLHGFRVRILPRQALLFEMT